MRLVPPASRAFIVLLTALVVAVVGAGATTDPEVWPLNEGTGSVFHDTAGQSNGALYGATWTSTPEGHGLSFRGDEFSDFAAVAGPFAFPQNTMSVEAWFRMTGHEGFDAIVSSDASCWACYRLLVSPDFHPFFNAGHHYDVEVPDYTFEAGRWYHYAMVISEGVVTIYVNGQSVFASTAGDGIVPETLPPFDNLNLAVGEAMWFHPLEGEIDQVSLASAALSGAEVAQRFSSGPIGVAGSTPVGTNVVVDTTATLPDGSTASVSISFAEVTAAGQTSVTTSSLGPPAPDGFKFGTPAIQYDLSTTATFAGQATVCFTWQDRQFHNENTLRLYHHVDGHWVDITSSRDTVHNVICGVTTSLSPFAVVEAAYTFSGFFSPVDNPPTRNVVKAGAAVPVRFSLNGDHGLGIFDAGFPASGWVQCSTLEELAPIDETVSAGNSSLSFNPATGVYTYVWKTDRSWAGTCRMLMLQFSDGTIRTAQFSLSR